MDWNNSIEIYFNNFNLQCEFCKKFIF